MIQSNNCIKSTHSRDAVKEPVLGNIFSRFHLVNSWLSCGFHPKHIHLYDYQYKGCTECYACKLKGGASFKRGGERIISPQKVRTAFLYTMNVTEQEMKYCRYEQNLAATHGWTKYILGYDPEIIYSYNTYQYQNYDSYVADLWDVSDKKEWHDEEFPKDCKNAFELGKKLVEKSM